ncbi:hypothetical protein LXL04_025285 [Taraxacum kok-saghyz]
MDEFVQNLVDLMENRDLELQNRSYNTAFSLAAASGNVKTAKIILRKNKAVVEIPGSQGMLPLYVAALYARSSMVSYLYDNSSNLYGDNWNDKSRGWVFVKCVEGDSFDVAAKILKNHPALISNKRLLTDVLLVLAKKTSAFVEKKPHNILRIVKSICRGKVGKDQVESEAMQVLKKVWEIISIMPRKEIDDIIRGPPFVSIVRGKTYPSRVLFVAAKSGNTRFILHLFQSYPDLAWRVDDHGQTIFHIAVKHRDAETYNLLYHIGAMKDIVTSTKDEYGNNMLHLVAKGATTHNVSGVALQMQQELLWYKEVEQMIPPASRTKRNIHDETPRDIFKKDHEQLLTEGGKWMSDTASQCMVVATLIATIVFAAAFTLPGGYDQNTGIPMFRQKAALIIFVVADAISLIFSSTSVLLFLSMFTSRHAESDFLDSLPKKLFFGLLTLFLSVTTMMIAFSASFFILYNKSLKWVPIMIVCVATLPVGLFAFLQFHLLGDVLFSTYRSRSLFKANKHNESMKLKKASNPEPVLEEFIPMKNNCNDDSISEITASQKDVGNKKNWLKSTHLWNANEIADQKPTSVKGNSSERTVEEDVGKVCCRPGIKRPMRENGLNTEINGVNGGLGVHHHHHRSRRRPGNREDASQRPRKSKIECTIPIASFAGKLKCRRNPSSTAAIV